MEGNSKSIKIVKIIFLVCVFGILLYWVLGQIFMPAENRHDEGSFSVFLDGWMQVKADGSREEITIPGKCEAERNEIIIVENILISLFFLIQ